jgi:hypothetical protein
MNDTTISQAVERLISAAVDVGKAEVALDTAKREGQRASRTIRLRSEHQTALCECRGATRELLRVIREPAPEPDEPRPEPETCQHRFKGTEHYGAVCVKCGEGM